MPFNIKYLQLILKKRCHTLVYTKLIGIDLREESLMFNLNKNLSYFIFLHEPDFFLLTYNPVTMPTTDTTLTFEELNDAYMTLTLEVS